MSCLQRLLRVRSLMKHPESSLISQQSNVLGIQEFLFTAERSLSLLQRSPMVRSLTRYMDLSLIRLHCQLQSIAPGSQEFRSDSRLCSFFNEGSGHAMQPRRTRRSHPARASCAPPVVLFWISPMFIVPEHLDHPGSPTPSSARHSALREPIPSPTILLFAIDGSLKALGSWLEAP